MLAHAFDVRDQMVGSVRGQVSRGGHPERATACAALVEQHDPERLRIEEAVVPGRAAGVRAAVEDQGRQTCRIAEAIGKLQSAERLVPPGCDVERLCGDRGSLLVAVWT
jgi:hypothetical protein